MKPLFTLFTIVLSAIASFSFGQTPYRLTYIVDSGQGPADFYDSTSLTYSFGRGYTTNIINLITHDDETGYNTDILHVPYYYQWDKYLRLAYTSNMSLNNGIDHNRTYKKGFVPELNKTEWLTETQKTLSYVNNTWEFITLDSYFYDSKSRLSEDAAYIKNTSGIYIKNMQKTYTYSSSGLLVNVIHKENNLQDTSITSYTYDANGNLIKLERSYYSGGVPQPLMRKFFTYNSNNVLTKYIVEGLSSGKWESNCDSNIVDSKGLIICKYYKQLNTSTNQWGTRYLDSNFYDSKNNLVRVLSYDYNSIPSTFSLARKLDVIYNAAGLREILRYYDYNGNTWGKSNGTYYTRFNYEPYSPTIVNAIANNKANNINISLYPTITSDYINLTITGESAVDLLNYAITDTRGLVLKRWSEKGKISKSVVVSDLPTGTYLLNVKGVDINSSQYFIISR